jgi:hypothetical protein
VELLEWNLIVARAAEDLQGVRQQIGNGVERFERAARAAGQIDDQNAASHARNGSGQDGAGRFFAAFVAHQFGNSGQQFLAGLQGGFGSGISRADSRASRCQDQVRCAAVGEKLEAVSYGRWFIGQDNFGDHVPAELRATLAQAWAGRVLVCASRYRITDG